MNFINVETGAVDLEPEQTTSIEAGFKIYNPSPDFRIDGSIYYTRTSNYINFNINRRGTKLRINIAGLSKRSELLYSNDWWSK